MINFIKNLFSGISAFFAKLFSFGKQKKSQLGSNQTPSSLKETATQVKETATQAATQAKETAAQATSFLDGTQVKETATQAATQVKETAARAGLFLTGDDARGYKSPSNGGQPSGNGAEKAKVSQSAASASALNLSKPKVTTQYGKFSNYGDRRRPGANMKSFLEMARQVKTSS